MSQIADHERTEVLRRLNGSLSSTCGVIEAAYFGAGARDQVDHLSDIDLVVQCDHETAARFVRRLDEVLEVVLYLPFTNDKWPAGRYWFTAASPFLRLDVSFFGSDEFQRLLTHGIGPKQPPFSAIPLGTGRTFVDPSRTLRAWSDVEQDFAKALWRFHESAKAVARGREPKCPLVEAEGAVQAFAATGLRAGVWELYTKTLSHLRSAALYVDESTRSDAE